MNRGRRSARCALTTGRLAPVALALLLSFSLNAQEVVIRQVRPSATQVDPAKEGGVRFQFDLGAPAAVKLKVYDGRDLLIREIPSEGTLTAGEQALTWDLRDQARKTVPLEAYTYTLEADAGDGSSVRYDLADSTGGESVIAQDVQWDARSGQVSYVLDRPARVNVRIGLSGGGPLLHTLVDWVARPAGKQLEHWDGKDASGVLDLTHHPKLVVSVQAFSLPQNSILVGAPQMLVKVIDGLSANTPARPRSAAPAKRMYAHPQQPLESRGDFKVRLVLPNGLSRAPSGVPMVSAPIPVRLEVDEADRERALARRFEPVFFVDGQFAFENEVGFVPMTWHFDPGPLNPGEHYLTVNLRGYEGNFGMATVKILVAN